MVILNCQKESGKFRYSSCASCVSRECENAEFQENLLKYKQDHPEKFWQCCTVCGHARGLFLFDERPVHADSVLFCRLHQRYLKTGDGLCNYHC